MLGKFFPVNKKKLFGAAFVCLAVLFILSKTFFNDSVVATRDHTAEPSFQYELSYQSERFNQYGSYALYQPYEGLGSTDFLNGDRPFYYPVYVFFYNLLPDFYNYNWFIGFHFLLFALLLYFIFEKIFGGTLLPILGTCAVISHSYFYKFLYIFNYSIAYLVFPLNIFFLLKIQKAKKLLWWAAAAVASNTALLYAAHIGNVITYQLSFCLFLIIYIGCAKGKDAGRLIIYFGSSFLLTILLALPKILPALQIGGHGARFELMAYEGWAPSSGLYSSLLQIGDFFVKNSGRVGAGYWPTSFILSLVAIFGFATVLLRKNRSPFVLANAIFLVLIPFLMAWYIDPFLDFLLPFPLIKPLLATVFYWREKYLPIAIVSYVVVALYGLSVIKEKVERLMANHSEKADQTRQNSSS